MYSRAVHGFFVFPEPCGGSDPKGICVEAYTGRGKKAALKKGVFSMLQYTKEIAIPCDLELLKQRISQCRLQLSLTTYSADSPWSENNEITFQPKSKWMIAGSTGQPELRLRLSTAQEGQTRLQAVLQPSKLMRRMSRVMNAFLCFMELLLILSVVGIIPSDVPPWVLLIPPAFYLWKQFILWASLSMCARFLLQDLLAKVSPTFSS